MAQTLRVITIWQLWAIIALSAQGGEAVQPWQKPYTRGEAVIALWQFEPGAEVKDTSGHGHALSLRGKSRIVEDGKFGSCLECFPCDGDKPEGAMARRQPAFSPSGAFTVEMWFRPKPELMEARQAFLLDHKYFHYQKDLPQANTGYCLLVSRSAGDQFAISAMLGYGKDSVFYRSHAMQLEPGEWYHAAFTYDGAGTGCLYLNGGLIGKSSYEDRGAITPARHDLVIGARVGSIHNGFPGYIDQVRISKRVIPFRSGRLLIRTGTGDGRTAFMRMEKGVSAQATIDNDTGKALSSVATKVSFGGTERSIRVGDLAAGQTHDISVPVDTSVRAGTYPLEINLSGADAGRAVRAEARLSITIVNRRLPRRMPVVMWGGGDFERLKEIGFTHHLYGITHFQRKAWEAGKPTTDIGEGALAKLRSDLDEHLVQGVDIAAYVRPGGFFRRDCPQLRVDRDGKPYENKDVCGLFPEVQAFAYNDSASIAQALGHFPSFTAVLMDSETRGHTNLCFHEHDRSAFREFAKHDVPREVVAKSGVTYGSIQGFPRKRVIPDDDPILTFYRWFWKQGDGWNQIHTQTHKGLHSTGRDDLWTFYDPAVRVPCIWGSGGDVDILSQWTYCYPDPIKMGQSTDELFAMADGGPSYQKVMKMTQVIWYRSQTAPELPKDEREHAQWEKDIPDARFITVAPDCMRVAFWSKLARPIRGIMYHGWGSLVEAGKGGYRFTHPESRWVLRDLIRDVVRPLGPTLLQVPDRKSDVAILESFTSQMFGARGTWGWSGGWVADVHLMLQWAQLQPRIIYDEHILRDGLDDYQVLVMPRCDVLTESVANRIAEFQNRGGIIVADEYVAPAIYPDIMLRAYKRKGKAKEDKAALQTMVGELRKELDPFYERYGESSSPDVVVRLRRYRSTDYLFAINDKRTYGRYVGHHAKVMEKGLPNSAALTVRRDNGYVYDLVAHRQVSVTPSRRGLLFEVEFGPGEGRLFMITDQKIAGVEVTTSAQAKLGDRVTIGLAVVDAERRPVEAVVPVQLEILDPKGEPGEFSGYYGAKDGALSVNIDIAPNDLAGPWTIRATELASGLRGERQLSMRAR